MSWRVWASFRSCVQWELQRYCGWDNTPVLVLICRGSLCCRRLVSGVFLNPVLALCMVVSRGMPADILSFPLCPSTILTPPLVSTSTTSPHADNTAGSPHDSTVATVASARAAEADRATVTATGAAAAAPADERGGLVWEGGDGGRRRQSSPVRGFATGLGDRSGGF